MNDKIRDFLKIMENQFIGVTIMMRSRICREYKILNVNEKYVRAYNYITSKEEKIEINDIQGVYVSITRIYGQHSIFVCKQLLYCYNWFSNKNNFFVLSFLHIFTKKIDIIMNKKKIIDENVQYFLNEGVLPNGYKPIIMEDVEGKLRSQGAIDTNELLEIIHKY